MATLQSTVDLTGPSTVDTTRTGTVAVPAAPRAVVVWPPRARDRILGIPVGLLVCWQLAGLLALAGFGRPREEAVLFWFAGMAIVGASALRLGRRWSYEWVALWWAFRARARHLRRAARGGAPPGIATAEWAVLRASARAGICSELTAPDMRRAHGTTAAAQPAAIIEHAGGISAVVEIAGLSADMLDLPLTLLPPFDPDGPEFALQAVLHVRPQPPVDWAGGALLAIVALPDPVWTPEMVRPVLASAVGKLLDRLRRQGYVANPVGAGQIGQLLRVLTMLDIAPRPDGPVPGAESWMRWRIRGVHHETVRLRTWSTPLTELVRKALTVMPSGMTVALAARRAHRFSGYPGISETDRVVAAQLHIRVSELDGRRLTAAAKALRRQLRGIGAKVHRLDGRQARGLAATLPLGGFLP